MLAVIRRSCMNLPSLNISNLVWKAKVQCSEVHGCQGIEMALSYMNTFFFMIEGISEQHLWK